jgi:hypothetical protein
MNSNTLTVKATAILNTIINRHIKDELPSLKPSTREKKKSKARRIGLRNSFYFEFPCRDDISCNSIIPALDEVSILNNFETVWVGLDQ